MKTQEKCRMEEHEIYHFSSIFSEPVSLIKLEFLQLFLLRPQFCFQAQNRVLLVLRLNPKVIGLAQQPQAALLLSFKTEVVSFLQQLLGIFLSRCLPLLQVLNFFHLSFPFLLLSVSVAYLVQVLVGRPSI